jgi:hypothetical protein
MWVPDSATELEAAVRTGAVVESASLDAKRELPAANKNVEIAVDVSAMAVDGGTIIYGLDEDEDGRVSGLAPFELAGAAERVDQVVRSSVAEVPFFETKRLELQDGPRRGYLIVVVPPSARAPHQIVARGKYEGRFYGRGPTGNRLLGQGDVARLYERRAQYDFDAKRHLAEVADAALEQRDEQFADMHAFARPTITDDDFLRRARGDQTTRDFLLAASRAAKGIGAAGGGYMPDLRSAAQWQSYGGGSHVYVQEGRSSRDESRIMLQCEVLPEGEGRLFCGRVGDTTDTPDGVKLLFEHIAAGNLATFLTLMGAVYTSAAYFGSVELGVRLTGLSGGQAHTVRQSTYGFAQPYAQDSFERVTRVAAAELTDPRPTALRLLRDFIDSSVEEGFDPFTR